MGSKPSHFAAQFSASYKQNLFKLLLYSNGTDLSEGKLPGRIEPKRRCFAILRHFAKLVIVLVRRVTSEARAGDRWMWGNLRRAWMWRRNFCGLLQQCEQQRYI
jgi:hypothetical protein